MTHKKLLAQGGTVHYWINKKKKDADCIVFTHGLTADHTMFAKQAAYFSKKYTTIFWDVPMHGLSRPYKNFSYHDTAKSCMTFYNQKSFQKSFWSECRWADIQASTLQRGILTW